MPVKKALPDLLWTRKLITLFRFRRIHLAITILILPLTLNVPPLEAGPPLKTSIIKGDSEAVRTFLERGGNPDKRLDRLGNTSLIIAARQNRLTILKMLLRNGASIDKKNHQGLNPLTTAAASGHYSIAEVLIKNGANANVTVDGGTSFYARLAPPIVQSAREGHEKITKLLLDAGANIDVRDNTGKTALFWASCNCHSNVVKLLLDRDARSTVRDKDRWTPLMCACWNGCPDTVRFLLSKNPAVNARNSEGSTALGELARSETEGGTVTAIARSLIRSGAKVDRADSKNRTPLYHAVRNRHYRLGEVLVNQGADPLKQDVQGINPIDLALSRNNEEFIKLFLREGVPLGALSKTHRRKLSILRQSTTDKTLEKLIDLRLRRP